MSETNEEVRFTSTSLADKKALQVGDTVCFQYAQHKKTNQARAVNVQGKFYFHSCYLEKNFINFILVKRRTQESTIDSIKGEYGFIFYNDSGEMKNLFFHSTNLVNIQMSALSPGDTVQETGQ